MDITMSKRCRADVPIEKTLQRQIGTLSKNLSACLVQTISNCLCRSNVLTEYEVQVIQSQTTDTQKASQLVQMVIRKGRRSCQLFFTCLGVCDPSLFEMVTGYKVTVKEENHNHSEDICIPETTAGSHQFIIKIKNSSLTNCIIGNNNDLSSVISQTHAANADPMEYAQGTDQEMTEQDSTEANIIQMERSHVEYVIIGDNNFMSIGTSQDSEEQEQREHEPEDSEG